MLQDRGRQKDVVRVLDFGIAKLRDDTRATQQAMTQAGDMLGTPQYMAPEQIRGEAIDGRTDVYALGCMIYEMVTARLPFEAPTVMAMLSQAPDRDAGAAVAAPARSRICRRRSMSSCSRAMAKEPGRAPADDGAVRRADRRARGHSPSARSEPARNRSRRAPGRQRGDGIGTVGVCGADAPRAGPVDATADSTDDTREPDDEASAGRDEEGRAHIYAIACALVVGGGAAI